MPMRFDQNGKLLAADRKALAENARQSQEENNGKTTPG